MSKEIKPNLKIKKKWIVLLIVFIILTSLILYSRYISTSGLKVHEIKITNNKIPDSFHGIKIVHFSDIHFGTVIKAKQFGHIIDKIKLLRPDILIFTGDLIDKSYSINNKGLNIINSKLNSLEIPIGKYAVLGEDDVNNNDTQNILESNNFVILKNNTELIYNKSTSHISISGFDIKNYSTKNMILEEGVFNILMTHKGDYLKNISNIDLALGGHSHNGQIQIPFLGSLYNKSGSKLYNEHYYITNNTRIYITNGIGTSDYKFRFFNKPSINFYRLTNK